MYAKVLSVELEVREMKINKNNVKQVNDIRDKNENKEEGISQNAGNCGAKNVLKCHQA